MKKLALSLTALLLIATCATAQENVDVIRETITKKVRVSDKYSEEIKVTEEVEEEIQIINVNESDQTNQNSKRLVNKTDKTKVLLDASNIDTDKMAQEALENELLKKKIKAKQAAELHKSKATLMANKKAEATKLEEKKMLMEQERLQKKALLERKVGQSKKKAKDAVKKEKKALKNAKKLKKKENQ